jgi:hypothetical protein
MKPVLQPGEVLRAFQILQEEDRAARGSNSWQDAEHLARFAAEARLAEEVAAHGLFRRVRQFSRERRIKHACAKQVCRVLDELINEGIVRHGYVADIPGSAYKDPNIYQLTRAPVEDA